MSKKIEDLKKTDNDGSQEKSDKSEKMAAASMPSKVTITKTELLQKGRKLIVAMIEQNYTKFAELLDENTAQFDSNNGNQRVYPNNSPMTAAINLNNVDWMEQIGNYGGRVSFDALALALHNTHIPKIIDCICNKLQLEENVFASENSYLAQILRLQPSKSVLKYLFSQGAKIMVSTLIDCLKHPFGQKIFNELLENYISEHNSGADPAKIKKALSEILVGCVRLIKGADDFLLDTAKNLLNQGADPNFSFTENSKSLSLLDCTLEIPWNNKIIDLLLNAGVNVNTVLSNGATIVFFAIRNKDNEIVKKCLAKNANLSHTVTTLGDHSSVASSRNTLISQWCTPLSEAVKVSNLALVKLCYNDKLHENAKQNAIHASLEWLFLRSNVLTSSSSIEGAQIEQILNDNIDIFNYLWSQGAGPKNWVIIPTSPLIGLDQYHLCISFKVDILRKILAAGFYLDNKTVLLHLLIHILEIDLKMIEKVKDHNEKLIEIVEILLKNRVNASAALALARAGKRIKNTPIHEFLSRNIITPQHILESIKNKDLKSFTELLTKYVVQNADTNKVVVLKHELNVLLYNMIANVEPGALDKEKIQDEFYAQAAELLLKSGANPQSRHASSPEKSVSFLYLALKNGRREVAEVLLKYKADLNVGVVNNQVNAAVNFSDTPIGFAVFHHSIPILKLLLNSNQMQELAVYQCLNTIAEAKVKELQEVPAEMIDILIAHCTGIVFPNIANPLHHAISFRKVPLAKKLITAKLYLDSECFSLTPLLLASMHSLEILQFLLANNAKTHTKEQHEITDRLGNTALINALNSKNYDIATYLINLGFNIHRANLYTATPLDVLLSSVHQKSYCDRYKDENVCLSDFKKIKEILMLLLNKGGEFDPKLFLIYSQSFVAMKDFLALAPTKIWKSVATLASAQKLLDDISSICNKVNFLFAECELAPQKTQQLQFNTNSSSSSAAAAAVTTPQSVNLVNLKTLNEKMQLTNMGGIINARRINDKKTALHLAIDKKHYLLAFLLIQAGADLTLKDANQKTAWQMLPKDLAALVPLCTELCEIHQQFVTLGKIKLIFSEDKIKDSKKDKNELLLEEMMKGLSSSTSSLNNEIELEVEVLKIKIKANKMINNLRQSTISSEDITKIESLKVKTRGWVEKVNRLVFEKNEDFEIKNYLFFNLKFLYSFDCGSADNATLDPTISFKGIVYDAFMKITRESVYYSEACSVLSMISMHENMVSPDLCETPKAQANEQAIEYYLSTCSTSHSFKTAEEKEFADKRFLIDSQQYLHPGNSATGSLYPINGFTGFNPQSMQALLLHSKKTVETNKKQDDEIAALTKEVAGLEAEQEIFRKCKRKYLEETGAEIEEVANEPSADPHKSAFVAVGEQATSKRIKLNTITAAAAAISASPVPLPNGGSPAVLLLSSTSQATATSANNIITASANRILQGNSIVSTGKADEPKSSVYKL